MERGIGRGVGPIGLLLGRGCEFIFLYQGLWDMTGGMRMVLIVAD
jgi:hypothetical protein